MRVPWNCYNTLLWHCNLPVVTIVSYHRWRGRWLVMRWRIRVMCVGCPCPHRSIYQIAIIDILHWNNVMTVGSFCKQLRIATTAAARCHMIIIFGFMRIHCCDYWRRGYRSSFMEGSTVERWNGCVVGRCNFWHHLDCGLAHILRNELHTVLCHCDENKNVLLEDTNKRGNYLLRG